MVTIFTQPTCGQCRTVKMLLKQKKIEFIAVEDVDKMTNMGINHTPSLLTPSGEILTGTKMIDWIRREGDRNGN